MFPKIIYFCWLSRSGALHFNAIGMRKKYIMYVHFLNLSI